MWAAEKSAAKVLVGGAGQRAVLLHAHLFKNAGTTLDWSLSRSFGLAFCDHRDDAQMRGNPEFLQKLLRDDEDLRALSSHWLPLPLSASSASSAGPTPRVVTLLRHPIERMASVYEFERRQDVDHPGTRNARELNFQDYVAWRLQGEVGPVIRNYQTRMLSGVYPGAGDDAQLGLAMQTLGQFAAVGLVERYDESMVMFEASLSEWFPDLDLAYQAQNVRNGADQRSSEEKLRDVEMSLGGVLEPAREANALDLRLYDAARQLFEQRLAAIERREQRLVALRARCAQLGE